MSPSVGQFIGFFALVIILSALAIALNRRIEKRRMAEDTLRNSTWVQLDVRRDSAEEPSPEPEGVPQAESEPVDEHTDESSDQSLHARAKQNGHYSESKKLG